MALVGTAITTGTASGQHGIALDAKYDYPGATMGYRENIVKEAKYWAEPGSYPMKSGDFTWICEWAGIETLPTKADLEYTRVNLTRGNLRIGGGSKAWCGIFAVAIWSYVGVGVKWTLNWTASKGSVLHAAGLDWRRVNSGNGIRKGDIAFIRTNNHHYIVTSVGQTFVSSVDGNREGNTVKEFDGLNAVHAISSIQGYYTILD
jgi:hypothetical protein